MGRPVKKRRFGNTANAGQQMQCSAWIPGDTQARVSYIVSQHGSRRFKVTNTFGTGFVRLVDTTASAAGLATIAVTPVLGGPTEYARTIFDKTVHTYEGNKYVWGFAGDVLATSILPQATIASA